MKYEDIKTREQLMQRLITKPGEKLPVLSVGNKMLRMQNFLTKTPDATHTLQIKVIYTHTGIHQCIRYL